MKKLSSRPPGWGLITLLSVSNEPDHHQTLNDLVPDDEFLVESAASCRDAMQRIRETAPAVITCDHLLPDGSWRDLLEHVSQFTEPPPLIVMARHADERLWAEVLNLGGYDLLAKPLDRMEVNRVLRMACHYSEVALSTLNRATANTDHFVGAEESVPATFT